MKNHLCSRKTVFALWVAAFALSWVAIAQSLAPAPPASKSDRSQIPPSEPPSPSHPSSSRRQAEAFNFEARIEGPETSVNLEGYTESLTHENGLLDFTILPQGDRIRYLLQISTRPHQDCDTTTRQPCPPAVAPALGNVTEIQMVMQSSLEIGIYPIEDSGSGIIQELMLYSRQLYSDPSHGRLGCQRWGQGMLKINDVHYGADGTLETLDAELVRACEQTIPLPPVLLQNAGLPLPAALQNLEQFTYYAAWSFQMGQ